MLITIEMTEAPDGRGGFKQDYNIHTVATSPTETAKGPPSPPQIALMLLGLANTLFAQHVGALPKEPVPMIALGQIVPEALPRGFRRPV